MQCKPEMNRKRFVASANFQFSILNSQLSTLNSQLSYLRILLRRVEARAILPDIRTELAVSQDAGVRIVRLQLAEQVQQGAFLGVGAGIGRAARFVQTAFIADADAVVVPAGGMGTDVMDGTATVYLAVAGDIEVVANLSKTTRNASRCNGLPGGGPPGSSGRSCRLPSGTGTYAEGPRNGAGHGNDHFEDNAPHGFRFLFHMRMIND